MSKRKFVIVTDSTCDMPAEFYKKKGVEVVKLGFTMDNVNYEGDCGQKITEKVFYEKLRTGSMPTTYQVTVESARPHLEKYLKDGQDVLVIAFSSALSGTADSFSLCAKELSKKHPTRKLYMVDSLCASMGEGLLLYYAIKKADEGADIEETAKYLQEIRLKICHYFTVDNLFHLKRGGRVSSASAFIGTLLKIKPIMRVNDGGKLEVISKCVGRKKALSILVSHLFADWEEERNEPVFISHGDCLEEAEFVKSMITQRFPNTEIMINYIGPVIGSHSGAGTLAIFYKGEKR